MVGEGGTRLNEKCSCRSLLGFGVKLLALPSKHPCTGFSGPSESRAQCRARRAGNAYSGRPYRGNPAIRATKKQCGRHSTRTQPTLIEVTGTSGASDQLGGFDPIQRSGAVPRFSPALPNWRSLSFPTGQGACPLILQ